MRVADPDSARWKEAERCFKAGDLAKALSIMVELDRDGEHYASTEIGNMYEIGGPGVPRSYEEAAKWYRKAIFHLDDPKAHLALAKLHLNPGFGAPDRDAFHRHASAAGERGEPLAFVMLGMVNESGTFSAPDLKSAQTFYEKAAAAGMVLAKRRLAIIAFKSGRPFVGLRMYFQSVIDAFRIALRDRRDPRL